MKAHAPRAKARHYCSPAALLGAGIAALMLLAGAPARAATYTWTGTGTAAAARNWFTGSNWSGGSVPLATDMVIINSVNGPVLDSVSATAANIQIATAAGAAGRLELNNASLATTAANTFIATQSTGTAFIVMRDSTWTSSSDNINFGNNGRAVVDLFGSSTINITGGDTGLAQNATASAVMTMNDSSVWIGRNTVHIGLRGSGTLFMNDNSSLLAGAAAGNNFTIGGNSATTGRGWMEAADAARITAAGFARIGMQGTGVLILRDSATMTANAGVFLGMTAVTGSGAVTVADSAMLRSGAGFTIGENGAGVLTLRDGGAVQVASGTVVLARLGAASGRLEITGSRGGVITGTGAMGAAVIDGGPGTGGARVVFAHGDANYVFANRLAGTLSVEHTGAGFTTLTGANDYTGGTIVRGGTLAGTTDSVRGDITADGAVVLDVAAPGRTLALSGSGLFNKTGPGTL
ncbi:MAG: autotransporter-associated beta strand repeat-containing protein, partial [Opitutaceae bacterium]|nr:autotransporter-associated beta strand repeat-containing protein [Opitutaceae bacterium]